MSGRSTVGIAKFYLQSVPSTDENPAILLKAFIF